MARYIVNDTEQDSLDASATIDERARPVYSQAGYEIDADGHIIGVNVGTGQSDPDAQRTERYAVPQQRLDGKWIIPHPECMPSATYVIPGTEPPVVLVDHLMAGLTDPVIEEYDPAWFPTPTLEMSNG
jgi:hypothetical protein